MSVVTLGFIASFLAGVMTGVGAIPVLFRREVSQGASDALLGFAAGAMLAASFFSLILPAIDIATAIHGGRLEAASIAVGGVLFRSGFMAALNEWIPHEHFFQGRQGPRAIGLERI